MKYPTMRFVFDRKKVATKTHKGLVQIEVLSEGKRKWIGTGVKVYSDQWNDRKKIINSVEMIQLNQLGQRKHFHEIFFTHPSLFYDFPFNERYHSVSATDSEHSYLGKGHKKQ